MDLLKVYANGIKYVKIHIKILQYAYNEFFEHEYILKYMKAIWREAYLFFSFFLFRASFLFHEIEKMKFKKIAYNYIDIHI